MLSEQKSTASNRACGFRLTRLKLGFNFLTRVENHRRKERARESCCWTNRSELKKNYSSDITPQRNRSGVLCFEFSTHHRPWRLIDLLSSALAVALKGRVLFKHSSVQRSAVVIAHGVVKYDDVISWAFTYRINCQKRALLLSSVSEPVPI